MSALLFLFGGMMDIVVREWLCVDGFRAQMPKIR
jgi:hypothetical protein